MAQIAKDLEVIGAVLWLTAEIHISARSEVAATRAMANAARLMADHPALLQLRTLQAVEAGGATVVLR